MRSSQKQRDMDAIRTVLRLVGPCTYPEIALRGGEGLRKPLNIMVDIGEVIAFESNNNIHYMLKEI